MDIHVLFFIAGLFNFIHTDGRLIQNNKTKIIEEVHTEKPNPVIRLTRNMTSESMVGVTKEDSAQSKEFSQVNNRRARKFDEEATAPPKSSKVKRISRSETQRRDSKENVKAKTSTTTTIKQPKDEVKPKRVTPLVKKPIPKFNEVDYEDFQAMINKVHIIADTGDREDEDFNISDYDFDINHDEFTSASMKKQIEPRIRIKNKENKNHEKKITLRNVEDSVITKQTSNKKVRSVQHPKQTDHSRDKDYYDEANDETTKGQSKGSSRVNQDDQYSDEDDDKESNEKKKVIRTSRSPDRNLNYVKMKLLRAAMLANILPRKSHN